MKNWIAGLGIAGCAIAMLWAAAYGSGTASPQGDSPRILGVWHFDEGAGSSADGDGDLNRNWTLASHAWVKGRLGRTAVRFNVTNAWGSMSDAGFPTGNASRVVAFAVRLQPAIGGSGIMFGYGADDATGFRIAGRGGTQYRLQLERPTDTAFPLIQMSSGAWSWIYVETVGQTTARVAAWKERRGLAAGGGIQKETRAGFNFSGVATNGTAFLGGNQPLNPDDFCNCTIDELIFASGQDNYGKIFNSFYRSISKGYFDPSGFMWSVAPGLPKDETIIEALAWADFVDMVVLD